jgi:hypothetical protein
VCEVARSRSVGGVSALDLGDGAVGCRWISRLAVHGAAPLHLTMQVVGRA